MLGGMTLKGDDGTYTDLYISVLRVYLTEYSKEGCVEFTTTSDLYRTPPITFTPPAEAINDDSSFGSLIITLFAAV